MEPSFTKYPILTILRYVNTYLARIVSRLRGPKGDYTLARINQLCTTSPVSAACLGILLLTELGRYSWWQTSCLRWSQDRLEWFLTSQGLIMRRLNRNLDLNALFFMCTLRVSINDKIFVAWYSRCPVDYSLWVLTGLEAVSENCLIRTDFKAPIDREINEINGIWLYYFNEV